MSNLLRSVLKLLLPVVIILLIGCSSSGDDGGGGGGGGTPAPDVPLLLNYGVGATNTTPRLALPSGTRADGAAFAFLNLQLSGIIDRGTDPNTITLVDYNTDWSIANGVTFAYNPSPASLGGGAIIVRISIPTGVTIRWIGGADPTEGTYVVSIVDAQGQTQRGPFTVVVDPNRPGAAGVNIYDAGNQLLSSLPWDGFKNAETSVNDYEALPSLAYNMLQTVYRYLSQAYTLLSIVVENDSVIQSQQVVGFAGDTFPGPGAGAANITVQWLDQDRNSDLGPGDGFMSNLSYWWDDVSEYIYNGHLRIIDYWENTAPSDNYVGGNFRFGPDTGPSDFTEQNASNNTIDPNRATVADSFFFLVYW